MTGRFALLIGNSTFDDPALERLTAPENDVKALEQVLGNRRIAGFTTELLLNKGLEDVQEAVFDLFHGRTADDLILLYYSGHGIRDDHNDLFFALPRTRRSMPGKSALAARYVREQMEKSHSLRQVLILDCCHSGAFMRSGVTRKGVEALSRDDVLPEGGHGHYVLAAASASQSAFEVEGRSIFTRHLVDALQSGEAAPEREEVTIQDQHDYVYLRVASEKAGMQPRIWVSEQTVPLVIARNPNPREPLPGQGGRAKSKPRSRATLFTEFKARWIIGSIVAVLIALPLVSLMTDSPTPAPAQFQSNRLVVGDVDIAVLLDEVSEKIQSALQIDVSVEEALPLLASADTTLGKIQAAALGLRDEGKVRLHEIVTYSLIELEAARSSYDGTKFGEAIDPQMQAIITKMNALLRV